MQAAYGVRVRDKVESLRRELELMRADEIKRRRAVGVVESDNGRAVYNPAWHGELNKALRPTKEWELGFEAGKKGREDRVIGGEEMKEEGTKREEAKGEKKKGEAFSPRSSQENTMKVSSDDATDDMR
jgi:hypothetical protein